MMRTRNREKEEEKKTAYDTLTQKRTQRNKHMHNDDQERDDVYSWLVRWMSRAWLLTNCRICFVSYGNINSAYIENGDAKIYTNIDFARASQNLYLLLSPLFGFIFFSDTLLFDADMLFCVTFYQEKAKKKKNWIQIWFNEIQSQRKCLKTVTKVEMKRVLYASVLRCEMRLKISQCYRCFCNGFGFSLHWFQNKW